MPSMSSRRNPASSSAALSAFAPSLSWLSGRKRPYSLCPMPTIAVLSRIRTEQEAARGAPGFDQRVRLRGLFQGERLHDHRLYLPTVHELQHVFQLVARDTRHRKHRLVLEEELRRVERNEVAVELTDQDPAPRHRQTFSHRIEEQRADV